MLSQTKTLRDIYLPIPDLFVKFSNKLQEVNKFLVQLIVAASANDAIRYKQNFFQISEVDTAKRFIIPNHWILRDIAQLNASH